MEFLDIASRCIKGHHRLGKLTVSYKVKHIPPYNPAVPLLHMYLRSTKIYTHKKTSSRIFMANSEIKNILMVARGRGEGVEDRGNGGRYFITF